MALIVGSYFVPSPRHLRHPGFPGPDGMRGGGRRALRLGRLSGKVQKPQVPLCARTPASVRLEISFVPLLQDVETISDPDGEAISYGHVHTHVEGTHSVPQALILSAHVGGFAARSKGRQANRLLTGMHFPH